MSEEWDFYRLRVDGEPASIFLDMGIATQAPVRGYDRMAYLRVRMLRPRDDGLSSQEEYDDLIAMEDAVTTAVKADRSILKAGRKSTLYVGRNTSHGNRDFYFYTLDAKRFERAARVAMAAFPVYRFEIGGRPDPAWETYRNFLYPSTRSRQQIGNRQVLAELAKHGDVHDTPREIDHLALFGDVDRGAAFAAAVQVRGFSVRPEEVDAEEDGRLRVLFVRADRPADIDDIVDDLFQMALEHGGEYDGWGCPVVRDAPADG